MSDDTYNGFLLVRGEAMIDRLREEASVQDAWGEEAMSSLLLDAVRMLADLVRAVEATVMGVGV